MTKDEERLLKRWKSKWEAGDEVVEKLLDISNKRNIDISKLLWGAVHCALSFDGFENDYLDSWETTPDSNKITP